MAKLTVDIKVEEVVMFEEVPEYTLTLSREELLLIWHRLNCADTVFNEAYQWEESYSESETDSERERYYLQSADRRTYTLWNVIDNAFDRGDSE